MQPENKLQERIHQGGKEIQIFKEKISKLTYDFSCRISLQQALCKQRETISCTRYIKI